MRGAAVGDTPVEQRGYARHGEEEKNTVAGRTTTRHGMEKTNTVERDGMKKNTVERDGMEKKNTVGQRVYARHGKEKERTSGGASDTGADVATVEYRGVFRVLNPSQMAESGDKPAIVDTGAGISIVNDIHLLDQKTLQETNTTIIGVGGQQVATIKGLAHVVVQTLNGERVHWTFPAVYQPLCPENLIAVRGSDDMYYKLE